MANRYSLILSTFGLGGLVPAEIEGQALEAGAGEAARFSSGAPAPGNLVITNLKLTSQDGAIELDLSREAVLVDIEQEEIIEETTVQGRPGTVKEYITQGDWQINIRGTFAGNDINVYPQDQMDTLLELIGLGEAIEVESEYLQLYGISNIVVTGKSFPQRKGFTNTQLFELQCLSDNPEELIIEENE